MRYLVFLIFASQLGILASNCNAQEIDFETPRRNPKTVQRKFSSPHMRDLMSARLHHNRAIDWKADMADEIKKSLEASFFSRHEEYNSTFTDDVFLISYDRIDIDNSFQCTSMTAESLTMRNGKETKTVPLNLDDLRFAIARGGEIKLDWENYIRVKSTPWKENLKQLKSLQVRFDIVGPEKMVEFEFDATAKEKTSLTKEDITLAYSQRIYDGISHGRLYLPDDVNFGTFRAFDKNGRRIVWGSSMSGSNHYAPAYDEPPSTVRVTVPKGKAKFSVLVDIDLNAGGSVTPPAQPTTDNVPLRVATGWPKLHSSLSAEELSALDVVVGPAGTFQLEVPWDRVNLHKKWRKYGFDGTNGVDEVPDDLEYFTFRDDRLKGAFGFVDVEATTYQVLKFALAKAGEPIKQAGEDGRTYTATINQQIVTLDRSQGDISAVVAANADGIPLKSCDELKLENGQTAYWGKVKTLFVEIKTGKQNRTIGYEATTKDCDKAAFEKFKTEKLKELRSTK